MDPYQVIINPMITEKATKTSQQLNAYPFKVHPKASKRQIRAAVEKIYRVRVTDVRTANRRGKPRRTRTGQTTATSKWKKAVVVLHPDSHIDLF